MAHVQGFALSARGSRLSTAQCSGLMEHETDLANVAALLELRFGLDALIVFGSVARDSARADSDLDLAALLRSRPSAIALLEARADIERSVGRGVDLVDLESASPVLAMQIFRDGRCVFGENSPALAAFRAILPSRYADLKRVRSGAEAALAKRVARGS